MTLRLGENEIIIHCQALTQCFRLGESIQDGNIFYE